jgi:hypothetical protein
MTEAAVLIALAAVLVLVVHVLVQARRRAVRRG